MTKKQPTNPLEEEIAAEENSEAMTGVSDEASSNQDNADEVAQVGLVAEEGSDTDQATSAEVAAISEVKEPAKKNKTKAKPVATKGRSAKYKESLAHLEPGKLYAIVSAIELVKKTSFSKFDGSVELHLKLNKKKAKGSTESSKGVFNLPHGSGKTKKIIILDEAKIEEIQKTKKIDFDIALASPDLMPKIARIAKILGPKGKMPDPKSGTVTTDPEKTIAEINSGKVEYRIDSTDNIHQPVGKVSWDGTKLKENIEVILKAFPKSRISAAYVTASMSPSIALDLSSLK